MKKFLLFLAAISLVFAMLGSAGASPITLTDSTTFYSDHTDPNVDLDSYGGTFVNKLEHILDWVTWTHHFTFSPPADQLLNATLTVSLRDNENDRLLRPWTWELGFGYAESGDWDLGDVDTGDYAYGIDVSYLTDGAFQITIGSLLGDFYIDQSELEINYSPVPEPASMLLLGSGLVGIAWFRRKFRKS